jgi:YqcI/YcgG family
MSGFLRIQRSVECPFADRSRMVAGKTWDAACSVKVNVAEQMELFEEFIGVARRELLDGFVLELTPDHFGRSIDHLSRTTCEVLSELSKNDPVGVHCMRKSIEKPGWFFSFAGERLFVLTFAPCYPPSHSRYGFGSTSTFIVFQPDHAFSRQLPSGHTSFPADIRNSIRASFSRNGRAYDTSISESPIEAYKYVKPLKVGDPLVRWWEG